jgi:hypothetical protein
MSSRAACSVRVMDRIKNKEALIDIFGRWPSFHDAEIISIYLDRDGGAGPFLEAKIHLFEMTDQVEDNGAYVLRHHTLVTFRFAKVVMGEVKWFNHQNVIACMSIDEVKPDQNNGCSFNVSIESSYGCEASFECREVMITNVEPFKTAA